MMLTATEFFDRLAPTYDALWTDTDVGRAQREAAWRQVDPFVLPASRVLDLGCGTGEDALHFARRGARVDAIDGSAEMVRVAQAKGVTARVLPLERLSELGGSYDIVFSNFGALNCVADLPALREPMSRLVRRQGLLGVCIMNRVCAWETAHFAWRGRFADAKRRWSGSTETNSGWSVFYPSRSAICKTLGPQFRLKRDVGVGLFVPPSYVSLKRLGLLRVLNILDRRLEALPVLRAIGDHRLLIFSRV